jgi:hypothetical protein
VRTKRRPARVGERKRRLLETTFKTASLDTNGAKPSGFPRYRKKETSAIGQSNV